MAKGKTTKKPVQVPKPVTSVPQLRRLTPQEQSRIDKTGTKKRRKADKIVAASDGSDPLIPSRKMMAALKRRKKSGLRLGSKK